MLRTVEKLFAVAMLFYTTGALLPFVTARLSAHSGLNTSSIELIIQTAAYALALSFIAVRWRGVAQSAWKVKWILALLAVAFISTGWSQDPLITLRRAAVLCATTAFGIYFATEFDVPDQLRLLACAYALVIAASFLCVLLFPQYGIDHTNHYGDWQGAFYQKNMLARAMVLSSLVFICVRFRSGQYLRWLGIAGSLVLLTLTQSVTGMVVFAIIIASFPVYKLFRTHFTFAVPVGAAAFTMVATSSAFAYTSLPTVLNLLNRNEGLTGRTDLWSAVLLSITKQPWLGYGFDAFWQGMHGESANVLLTIGWAPEYAHNGFLDLVLELGLFGLAIFAVGYFALWRQAITFLTRGTGPVAVWLCMYLSFMLLYNLTEGPVVSQNNVTWVMYVATAVSLALPSSAQEAAEKKEEAS